MSDKRRHGVSEADGYPYSYSGYPESALPEQVGGSEGYPESPSPDPGAGPQDVSGTAGEVGADPVGLDRAGYPEYADDEYGTAGTAGFAYPSSVADPGMVDLDSDPFADDLSKELAAAARKKWVNRTTVVAAGLVLIAGGFLGGIQVQKHFGSSTSNAAAGLAALRNATRGGTGGTGGFPGFGGTGGTGRTGTGGTGAGGTGGIGTGGTGGGGTGQASTGQTGTVKLVDGSTIYVSLPDGTVLTVTTNGSTTVTKSATSSVSSLKAGDTVTITGSTPDSNGNMTATSVTDSK